MKTSENHFNAVTMQASEIQVATEESAIQPLSPSKRAELWSGRFAMVGFVTAMAAIVIRSTP